MQGVHGPDLTRTLRRDKRPFWWGIIGGLVLAAYGVVATYQPPGLDFGRVYAAYGFVCCTSACPPARRRLLYCGRLQPAWTVVTGCGCRGYFILLSLLWGIYIDKSLVCAWCRPLAPTPMRTRLQPRWFTCSKCVRLAPALAHRRCPCMPTYASCAYAFLLPLSVLPSLSRAVPLSECFHVCVSA
jgi:drug/metabolite transporter superfamily protein YnfA